MNQEPLTHPEFYFLSETPNRDESTLKFGHRQVIASLRKIIKNCPGSMTIGLFGNWGSGKSSIVENLKTQLLQDEIPLVIFDVWKHDGDALRRTFLLELDRQLSSETYGKKYVTNLNILASRVYSQNTTNTEKYTIQWAKLRPFLGMLSLIGLIGAMLVGVVAGVTYLVSGTNLLKGFDHSYLSLGTAAFSVISGGILFKLFDNFIKTEKIEEKKERLQDPYEFEAEFKNLVANLSTRHNTLVIAFDNLDRVSGENALKVISTIKTFLDYSDEKNAKRVIFLVPCDVLSIRKHISQLFENENPDDANEFLRKFFNTTLYIPEFYGNELENFADEKLEETGISEFKNEFLSWLIIKAFDRNPRQIIQFINILITNYLVLKQFCDDGHFHNKNFYKENIPQLARFLLLKQRFPLIMEQYQLKGIYHLENYEFLNNLPVRIPDTGGFQELIEETRMIGIISLEPFFKFRLSKEEQELPEFTQLLEAITKGKSKKITIDTASLEAKTKAISNAIRTHFKGLPNRVSKIEFLSNLLEFIAESKIKFSNHLYRDFYNFTMSNLRDTFIQVSPARLKAELLDKISDMQASEFKRVLDFYLTAANQATNQGQPITAQTLVETVELLLQYPYEVNDQQLVTIRHLIVHHYDNKDVLFKFLDSKKAQEQFFDVALEDKLVKKLEETAETGNLLYPLEVAAKLEPNAQAGTLLAADLAKRLPQIVKLDAEEIGAYAKPVTSIMRHLIASGVPLHEAVGAVTREIKRLGNKMPFLKLINLLYETNAYSTDADPLINDILYLANVGDIRQLLSATPGVINDRGVRTLQKLFERSGEEDYNQMLVEQLNPDNFNYYLEILLRDHKTELLEKNLNARIADYTHEDVDQLAKAFTDAINVIDLGEDLVAWLLELLLKCFRHHSYVPENFQQFIVNQLIDERDARQFEEILLVIADTCVLPGLDKKEFGKKLADLCYQRNYSTFREIYEILFGLWSSLGAEEQNKVRDLAYQHLLPEVDDDEDLLSIAMYALDQTYDLEGCEDYFKDFVEMAENADDDVTTYYEKLARLILEKLNTYHSESYQKIKAGIRAWLDRPSDDKSDE